MKSIIHQLLRYSILFLAGIAVGIAIDFLVLNYQVHESGTVTEVFPTEIKSEALEDEIPYLNKEHAIEYFFEDGANVENICIQFDEEQRKTVRKSTLECSLLDEGNGRYYKAFEINLRSSGSQWFRIHPMGKLKQLRIKAVSIADFDELAEENYDKEAVENAVKDANIKIQASFNVPTQYKTHWLFIGATGVIFVLVYLFRPSSSIYQCRFDEHKWFVIAITVAVILVAAVASGVRYNPDVASAVNQRQYFELAEAFAHGQTAVLTEPSAELQAMDNPYDYNLRKANKVPHSWDHAYYNGRYYVYFGALPCVLLFLPYYLVTGGGELNMAVAIVIAALFTAWGLMRLLVSICRRWYPSCSQGLFLVMTFTLIGGSWIQYAAMRPTHYALPILVGLALLAWGLSLWVDATSQESIKMRPAIIGSILLALTVAARPQLLAGGLLVLILLVLHMRKYGPQGALKVVRLCALPVVVVFVVQGWYNYIRFDNPFDFGANYNITFNDMTKRGWELDRIPLALVAYLIQPFALGASTPFLRETDLDVGYNGIMITEKMLGGIFWLTPLLIVTFMLLFHRYRALFDSEKKVLMFSSLVLAIVIVVFDAQVAGVLQRYFMDFGVFLALPAVLVLGGIWGSRSQPLPKDESIARAEHILDRNIRGGVPSMSSAGLLLLLLVVGTVLPIFLVVFGL